MSDVLSTLTKRVLFSPLPDPGRTEVIVGRIRSAIMLGIFADGEQLPNEIELAAQFQVSPVTLRDALRVIRSEGLARTTRGRSGGTFVIAPDETNIEHFEKRLASISALDLRDLMDWQASLTSHGAFLAASRASADEATNLMNSVHQLANTDSAPRARRSVSRLLIEISAASRSAKLSREMITHQIEVSPHAMLVYRNPQIRADSAALGVHIVEAIKQHDPRAASNHAIRFTTFMSDRIIELRHDLVTLKERKEKILA